MTTLGTAVPPPAALTDAMALLRVIADPKAAKANLDALATLSEQIRAEAAALEAQAQSIAEEAAANAATVAKLEADGKALDAAKAEHARSIDGLRAQKAELVQAKADHAADVADNQAAAKGLEDRAAQLDGDKLAMQKRAAEIDAEQHARSLELNSRAKVVEKAEADLKAKVAEWQRVTKALQG